MIMGTLETPKRKLIAINKPNFRKETIRQLQKKYREEISRAQPRKGRNCSKYIAEVYYLYQRNHSRKEETKSSLRIEGK